MRLFVAAILVTVWAAPGQATEYSCTSDPGFCYRDVADDGCFDDGSDEGPIDAQLESGPYTSPGGSIICPPSVALLLLETTALWSTPPGSRVELFAGQIKPPKDASVRIDSGSSVLLTSKVLISSRLSARLRVAAEDDIRIEGKVSSPSSNTVLISTGGSIHLGPRTTLASGLDASTLGGGDIVLDDVRVRSDRFSSARVEATGDVYLHSSQLNASGVAIDGQNLVATGKLALTANRRVGNSIRLDLQGDIQIERLKARADFQIEMDAANVMIGQPGPSGKIARSVLLSSDEVSIETTGSIDLDRVLIRKASAVLLDTTGTDLTFVDGSVKNSSKSPGAATFSAGAGSTCDITGSTFINAPLVTSCDTVLGP